MLSTGQKGAIAETAITLAALKLGVDVYKPLVEGTRADLIFDLGNDLARVQCKWSPLHGDVVVVRCYSTRRTAEGLRRTLYTSTEIDAIASYCAELDRTFYIPGAKCVGRSQLHLRVAPSLNNQRDGVNWADDFAFESLHFRSLGP